MESGLGPKGQDFPESLLAVRRVVSLGGSLARIMARRHGLSDTDVVALEALAERSMGPAELARRLGVTTAAATGVVDRLVERGHAVRRPDEHDRRRVGVSLTDAGYADIRARLTPTIDDLVAVDAGFTDADRAVITRYLAGVTEVLEKATAEPAAEPGAD